MKNSKGSALTGVILMVLVMTLIGVPLLGLVVYNYRVVELNNSLKRSEYENEMAMDVISRIIRETVIDAIKEAKSRATAGVNEIAEIQRTNYYSSSSKYSSLWINEYNTWANKIVPDEAILGDFLSKIYSLASSEADDVVRSYWKGLDYKTQENIKSEAKNKYVSKMVADELAAINTTGKTELGEDVLDAEENGNIGMLLNDSGTIDEELLNEAYNMIFKERYQEYLKKELGIVGTSRILDASNYTGIINDTNNIDVTGVRIDDMDLSDESLIIKKENYLKIDQPAVIDTGTGMLNINVGTRFKKNKTTPATTLSATFVIDTPGFDSVASVTQESITLSNALLNQGGTIVGGKLEIKDNTTLLIKNDLTAKGGNREYVNGEEIKKTGIEIGKNAKLKADGDEGSFYSRIVTYQDIVLNSGANLITGTNPIYYRNLYAGTSGQNRDTIYITFNGDAVAEDDLEINYEGNVVVDQEPGANYYGFNDTNNDGPDSSSSIVINSRNLGHTISLGNLYLAGRAFIEDVRGTNNTPVYDEEGVNIIGYADTTYKTGESIAIKENYIAYQSPLMYNPDDVDDQNYMFLPGNVNFSPYFMKRSSNAEKQYATINFADDFIVKPEGFVGSFDVNGKWKYFRDYAKLYDGVIKRIKVTSNVRYIEGAGFNEYGEIEPSSNEGEIKDTSFRNNLADEYEKYAKYFGYRPVTVNAEGKEVVDSSKAKTEMFGTNGWMNDFSDSEIIKGNYYQIYQNGDKTISLSGNASNGIIVCKGNLTIELSENASFKGVIIVGGNLTIDGEGKTLTLEDGKEQIINTVIENYLGENTSITGEGNVLLDTFAYDGSGSSYIVTEIGDGLININDLIGITNWKKSAYGKF